MLRSLPGKLALVAISAALTLAALEFAIRAADIPPDGFLRTRAAIRWYEKYWKPVNRFGYRDIEHEYEDLRKNRRLIVLGDSFAAGSGVEDYRNRFANVLASALGEEWSVVVMAIPGWNTHDQLEALRRFNYPPDVLLMSYYLNDIEGAAAVQHLRYQPNTHIRPAWLERVVLRSDLANFVFWRLATSRHWSDTGDYADWIYARFADDGIWRIQREQLDALISVAREQGAEPVAVVFPHLFDIEGSRPALAQLDAYFDEREIPRLDVASLIDRGEWSQATLFASSTDPHPSVALHHSVAEALLPMISR